MNSLRYYELAAKLDDEIHESGIRLDLNCPCDRAILSECGLTAEEAFEFLALFDAQNYDGEDDTRRVVVGKW